MKQAKLTPTLLAMFGAPTKAVTPSKATIASGRTLDEVAKEMEAFRLAPRNRKTWRNSPKWKRLCAEFKPLYFKDYAERKVQRGN